MLHLISLFRQFRLVCSPKLIRINKCKLYEIVAMSLKNPYKAAVTRFQVGECKLLLDYCKRSFSIRKFKTQLYILTKTKIYLLST